MIVKEMIVTNADGKTKTVSENLSGTCIKAEDIYSFYAIKNVNDPSSKPAENEKAVKVRIVAPVGGKYNGMYRFPRVGEKVLVGVEGTSHYLMGYLPTTEDPFSSTTNEFDDEGFVLRYKKTGKNKADKDYSEISFTRKDTSWPTSDPSLQKAAFSKVVTKDSKNTYYPYVDRLDISSTGDIVSKAKNFNKIDGERVLLQSKFLTSSNIAVDKKKDETNGKDNTTVKEMTVEEKDIGKGDLILSADRRILLNAREGFTVQVGGCSLSLTPSGITLKAGKLDGAPAGDGPFDATLSLSSSQGNVDLTGRALSGSFDRGLSLSDAFGGAIDLEMGMASVNGTSVSMGAMTTASAIGKSVVGLANLIAQIVSVGLSTCPDYGGASAAKASKQFGMINSLIGGMYKYPALSKRNIEYPDSSTLDVVIKIVKVIYKIFDKVKTVLLRDFDNLAKLHYDSKLKKYYNDDQREACMMACSIIDATFQSGIIGMLLASAGDAMVHQATIDLTSNGAVAIDSKDYYQAATSDQRVAAVGAGINLGGGGGGSGAVKKAIKRHGADVVSFVMSEIGMYASFVTDSLTEETKKALGEL